MQQASGSFYRIPHLNRKRFDNRLGGAKQERAPPDFTVADADSWDSMHRLSALVVLIFMALHPRKAIGKMTAATSSMSTAVTMIILLFAFAQLVPLIVGMRKIFVNEEGALQSAVSLFSTSVETKGTKYV